VRLPDQRKEEVTSSWHDLLVTAFQDRRPRAKAGVSLGPGTADLGLRIPDCTVDLCTAGVLRGDGSSSVTRTTARVKYWHEEQIHISHETAELLAGSEKDTG
jgi:hypothetical protein